MIGGGFAASAIFTLTDLVSGPLGRIQAQLRATGAAGGGLSSQMGQLAVAMTPVVLAAGAVAGALGAVASATIESEAHLGELASVGVKDFTAMKAAAQDFSNQFAGTTQSQFLAAAYDIKGGINSLSDEGVAKFTALAALTGKATKSTVAEMTNLFAKGYDMFKGQFADLDDMQFGERLSAGISAAVNIFKTTGSGMAQAITSTQGAAVSAGVAMEEQFAVLGMLQGSMEAGASGTAYKAYIGAIGGAGEKLGLQFLDANKRIKSMPDVLDALRSKFGETIDDVERRQLKTALGSDEAIAVIEQLYAKNGNLRSSITQLGEATSQGSKYTLEMAQTMNQGLGAALQILGQRFHNLLEIIGGMFAPTLTRVVNIGADFILFLQDVATWLAGNGIGQAVMTFAGALSAGVLTVAALAAGSWALGAAIPFLVSALAPIGAAIVAISWPVWLLAAAVAGLYLAWKTNFGGMRDRLTAFWTTASLVARGVMAVFQSLTGSVGEVRGQLAEDLEAAGLVGAVTTLGRVVYRAWQLILGVWDGLSEGFRAMWAMLAPWFGLAASAIGGLIGLAGRLGLGLGLLAETTGADSWRVFGRALGLAMAAIAGGLALVKGFALAMSLARAGAVAWTAAQWLLNVALNANPIGLLVIAIAAVAAAVWYFWEPISSFVASLWDRVVGLWQAGVRTVAGWWDDLAAAVRAGADLALSVWDGLGAVVAALLAPLQAILDLIGRVLAAFGGFSSVGDLIEGAVSGLGGLLSGAAGLASGALSGLGDLAGRTASGIGGLVSDAASGLGALAAGAASGMGDLASGATAALTNFFGGADLSGAGAALLGSLGQGVQAGTAALADSVTGGLGAALDGLTDLGERAAGLFASAPAAIADLFGGIDLFASGAAILDTLWQGVQSRAGALYEGVASVFAQVRNLLPFSDAKEGPLSQLTLSGSRIMTTLGEGVAAGAPELTQATSDALAGVAGQLATPLTGPGIEPVQAQIPTVGLAGPLLADPVVPAASPGPAALPVPAVPIAAPVAPTIPSLPAVPAAGPTAAEQAGLLAASLSGLAPQAATGPGAAPSPLVVAPVPLPANPVVPAASPVPAALSVPAVPTAAPAAPGLATAMTAGLSGLTGALTAAVSAATSRVGGLFAGLAGGQPAPEPQAGPSLAAMLAPPTADGGGDPVRPLAQPPASATTNRRSLIIQSLSVTLPGVSDAKDFVADLQRLVEEYDAPGDPAEA